MNLPQSQTRTATTTMTAARVRNVMVEIAADLEGLVPAGFATYDQVANWKNDLTYILENEATQRFQVQLNCQGQQQKAIEYTVSADGTIRTSQTAGGLDFYSCSVGTKAALFVSINDAAPKATAVRAGLAQRGWGTNGVAVNGSPVTDRSYSSDGYGVRRSLIGEFQ